MRRGAVTGIIRALSLAALFVLMCAAARVSAETAEARGLPEPAGKTGGKPFYADFDYFYEAEGFARGKNFKTFSDGGGEKVWVWFSGGVGELRIYEVEYVPGPIGEYELDQFSLGQELYAAALGENDVLEFTTAIPEAAPPRRAIWFKDAGGSPRAYMLEWSGKTGAVRLRPLGL